MNKQFRPIFVFALTATLLVFAMREPPTARAATTRYVSPTGTNNTLCSQAQPCRKIRRAIGIALSGDIIEIAAGTYQENLRMNKDLTVRGAGVGETTIDGRGRATAIRVLGASVTLLKLTIKNGSAGTQFGGGIFNTGTLTMKKVNISSNSAQDGGGIYNQGTLRLRKVNLIGNTAAVSGGGLSNHGSANLKRTTIASNNAELSAGIENRGEMRVESSTLKENIASLGAAGGISNFNQLLMGNVTLSGNQTPAYGAGLYIESGSVTLVHATITANTAGGGGGGLANAGGGLTLYNTIVAYNTGGNCFGAVTDGGGNLHYAPADCGAGIAENEPLLASLANNGGFTETHALLPSSGAMDAGSSVSCVQRDQRGQVRPLDGDGDGTARCDVGAYEYQP